MAQSYRLEVGGTWFTAFRFPPYISVIWAIRMFQSRRSCFRASTYHTTVPMTAAPEESTKAGSISSLPGKGPALSKAASRNTAAPITPTITAITANSRRMLRCSKVVMAL